MKIELLLAYVDKDIQLKFVGDPNPVGPVKLEIVEQKHASLPLFRINLPAMMGAPGTRQPVHVILTST